MYFLFKCACADTHLTHTPGGHTPDTHLIFRKNRDKKGHISAIMAPPETVHLSKFAGFPYESNRIYGNVPYFVVPG